MKRVIFALGFLLPIIAISQSQVVFKIKSKEFNFSIPNLKNGQYGLSGGIVGVSGAILYRVGDIEHIIQNSADSLSPALHFIKQGDGEWEFENYYEEGSVTGGFRNYSIIDTLGTIAFASTGSEAIKPWPYGDLLIVKTNGKKLQWSKITSDKSFYHSVGTGDLNGDGLVDIVGLHMGSNTNVWENWNGVSSLDPWLQDNDSKFSRSRTITTDSNWSKNPVAGGAVFVGDIDKDGDLDIFALANDKSYFLINDGKGNFTITTNNINIASLGSLFTSELYDINKDGYIDLILGGHEFNVKDTSFKIATEYEGATRIYWGNSNYKYNEENVTYLPVNSYFGVVLDFDFADLDGDGKLEIAINRTGGRLVNNVLTDFYKNWAIQILKFDGTKWLDKTGAFIEAGMDLTVSKGPTWMKFYNKNDRLYYESLNINGDPLLQWVWENKKLKRLK
jgi:hypothetical protein